MSQSINPTTATNGQLGDLLNSLMGQQQRQQRLLGRSETRRQDNFITLGVVALLPIHFLSGWCGIQFLGRFRLYCDATKQVSSIPKAKNNKTKQVSALVRLVHSTLLVLLQSGLLGHTHKHTRTVVRWVAGFIPRPMAGRQAGYPRSNSQGTILQSRLHRATIST
jgi:hypothetical protein